MTSLPLSAERPISHGPSHPSTQVTQMPEPGAGSTLVVVNVAALRFGLLNDIIYSSYTRFFDKKNPTISLGALDVAVVV